MDTTKPLLDLDADEDQDRNKIEQFALQFQKVQSDFGKIEEFYELLKDQNDFIKQQSKSGSNEKPQNEITSVMKLKKKNEIDMLVRRGNIFNE